MKGGKIEAVRALMSPPYISVLEIAGKYDLLRRTPACIWAAVAIIGGQRHDCSGLLIEPIAQQDTSVAT